MNLATVEGRAGKNLNIMVSSMFSTCDVDRTAMLSTFENIEFKTHIFSCVVSFSSLILFGAGYGSG